MKGKISFYFSMPNVQRFRSRVANPDKSLTNELRELLTSVTVDVLNSSVRDIRARFIEAVNAKGLEFKSEAHRQKVMNLTENFFDAYFVKTSEELKALGDNDEAPADEPAAPDAPAADSEEFE